MVGLKLRYITELKSPGQTCSWFEVVGLGLN